MKILVESNKEGLEMLIGKNVMLLCANYFYRGKLIGVNRTCVKLENPSIVYDTGPWTNAKMNDEQSLNAPYWYVKCSAIESFGEK